MNSKDVGMPLPLYFQYAEVKCQLCWIQSHLMTQNRPADEIDNLKIVSGSSFSEITNKQKSNEPYDHHCVICKETTKWKHINEQHSKCKVCKTKATNGYEKCQGCSEETYIYETTEGKFCGDCADGLAMKAMTDFTVLPCLFCNDEKRTMLIFANSNKMRCQDCKGIKPI
jgi:hypothetical protein